MWTRRQRQMCIRDRDEIASVQEQNKGNQPEVSSSDQLELVSNKTEEKPVVQTENNNKEAEEIVLKSEKPVPSFNTDQINAATSNVSSRIIASPRAKKLASQMGVDLAKVHGSGPHGRIQADDILKANGQPVSIPWIGEGSSPASIPGANLGVESKPETSGNSFGNPGETVQFNAP